MTLLKRSLHLTTLAVLLALGLAIDVSAGVQAQAPRSPVKRSIPVRWEFKPPKAGNPRVGRFGAATRGDPSSCIQGNQRVTALVPASGEGTTVSAYPTFFWYLPRTSARQVEFVLKDEREQEIYSTKFAITGTPGVMNLSLPRYAALPPLEIGKEYTWLLAVICNPDRSADAIASAEVKRVAPDANLVSKFGQATPQERVALYADARLWYDTLNYLSYLRRYYPNDSAAAESWKNLLQSAELANIAEEKL